MPYTKTAVTVVTAPESVDFYTVTDFRAALRYPVEHGAVFVVADLNGVKFMDSFGMGVLVGALRRAVTHDCRFGVARKPHQGEDRVLRMFRLMGLDQVFDIRDSADEFGVEAGGSGG